MAQIFKSYKLQAIISFNYSNMKISDTEGSDPCASPLCYIFVTILFIANAAGILQVAHIRADADNAASSRPTPARP